MKLERRKALNPPMLWDSSDEKLLLSYLRKGSFDTEILKRLFPDRSPASIKSKVRKLRIKYDLFGSSYRDHKGDFTIKIAKQIKPKSIFEAYAGAGHQTFKWIEIADRVFASEKKRSKLTQFEREAKRNLFTRTDSTNKAWRAYEKGNKRIYFFLGDAVDAAADLKVNKIRIDLIDLDTCGSTLPLLPTILLLLKPRHLVITHGEFQSMRFKREDVLRRLLTHKDISTNPLPLDVAQMSKELDKAVKIAALRAHNETANSFWLELIEETWLGSRVQGMLRRYYKVTKPKATSDCINELSND